MTRPELIPMAGVRINDFQVLDRYFRPQQPRAHWWVRHDCGEEFVARGTNLRKAQRGGWEMRCPVCHQEPPNDTTPRR